MLLIAVCGMTHGCASGKKDDPCKNPEYAATKRDYMIDAFSRGNTYGALEAGLEAYRCNPKDPDTNYWLGWIYMNRDRAQYDKAINYLEGALKYKDPYPEVNMALGMIYLEQSLLDDAIVQFEIAADNDLYRNAFEAFNNLGWAYMQKGDLEKAEINLRQALKLNPNWCISHCNLGEVYLEKGKTDSGIKSLNKAVGLCPQYARPHLLLGIEYNRQKKIPHACREFNAALNADFKSREAHKAEEYMRLLNCKRTPGKSSP
jgi:Tfp pilus assembly protein PilF